MTRSEILQQEDQAINGQRELDYGNPEVWRKVDGFDQFYEVSNAGRVRTVEHKITRCNGRVQTINGRILKQSNDEYGYPQVGIRGKTVKVHRLVALAFLGKRENGMEIRHLDGNPSNNTVQNLEYGTHQENMLDCYKYRGCIKRGQRLSRSMATNIARMIRDGVPSVTIAEKYKVSQQTVCDIKHGRIYKGVMLDV